MALQKFKVLTTNIWENSKSQTVTKLKTQIVTKLNNSNPDISISEKNLEKPFAKNNLTPRQPMRRSLGSVLLIAMFNSE